MISIAEVARVVEGRVINSAPELATNGMLFFDTRKPVKDGIFLALRGENVDGHDFVTNSGGAFAFVEHEVNTPAIVVTNVMKAASQWAREWRI